jgi:parallel beta-helix repeat protein
VVRLRALLVVQGRLAATGAPSAPVIFSSGSPDGKGAGIFLVGSEKRNILENCRIEGGDTGVDASFTRLDLKNVTFARCRTGFRGQDCVLTLSGGGATGCDLGISLYDSEADIRGVDLTSNRIGMNVRRSSLYLSGSDFRKNSLDALSGEESRLALEQNRFSGNGNALSLSSCEGSVSGNRIRDNAGCGLLLQRSRIKVVGNDISGNGTFGIRVSDGMSVAWGNAIAGNAGFDLYNAGTETFRAAGNWWGEKTPLQKPGGIFDKSVDPHYGRVVSSPALAERPAAAP